jgi:isoquinoline 1-oxidoreductase subunit beta
MNHFALMPLPSSLHDIPTAPELEASGPATTGVSRRHFLGSTAYAAGALTLSFSFPALARRGAHKTGLRAPEGQAIGAWVVVAADETVTVYVGSSDMGQGVLTSLPQILADEMRLNWSQVRGATAPAKAGYGNPMYGGLQLTGGSASVRGYYAAMRTAGAALRELFQQAAATTWGVPVKHCKAAHGVITLKGTNTSLSYGQLAALAATLPLPANPTWLPDKQLKLIGQALPRVDIPAKVNGSAEFGIDVRLPGMVYAAVLHCPKIGGKLQGTPPVPAGALAVVPLGNAVAVVANSTWEAFKAAERLNAQWSIPPESALIDTPTIDAQAQELMAHGNALVAETSGDVRAGLARATRLIDATYGLPYLAHACMEPLCCTASVTSNSCEIWAPTQGQGINVFTIQGITGLSADQISIHTTMLGGGLGRKFEQDFIAQSVKIAKAMGQPVKLTWTREQDFGNDVYRPMTLARVQAGLDANGQVSAVWVRTVSPSIQAQRGNLVGVDASAVEGSVELPYAFASRQTDWVQHPSKVPVGYWRSVGHSINAFVMESAIDELALAGGLDPYQLRRQLLANSPRALKVLDAAAKLAVWNTPAPAGRARGIAFTHSFGSLSAQVAEVSMDDLGKMRVHAVAVAMDCGMAVNPGIVIQQMQGGIAHGLSAALWGQVPFAAGRATVQNYNRYRVLKMSEMPVVSVKIINSGEALGGIGEPGVPPIAPAIANAWAKLTGQRIRTLPMFPADGHMGEG